MTQNREKSIGQMISTLCFFGMAIWLATEAAKSDGSVWRIGTLWLTTLGCLAGGLRFQLQTVIAAGLVIGKQAAGSLRVARKLQNFNKVVDKADPMTKTTNGTK